MSGDSSKFHESFREKTSDKRDYKSRRRKRSSSFSSDDNQRKSSHARKRKQSSSKKHKKSKVKHSSSPSTSDNQRYEKRDSRQDRRYESRRESDSKKKIYIGDKSSVSDSSNHFSKKSSHLDNNSRYDYESEKLSDALKNKPLADAKEDNKAGPSYQNDYSDEVDTEDEIMFDWETHRRELNVLFFQDRDIIKRGTDQYRDFWLFLKRYQNIKKQKHIKQFIERQSSGTSKSHTTPNTSSLGLPSKFDSRYFVNFAVKGDSINSLVHRLPPSDVEDRKKLSKKKIEEFKTIILLYLNFNQKKNFEKLQKLRKDQSDLPIAQYRDSIVKTVNENSIVLIAGDTGCGKSTQVPQYLMHAGYANIACTQPRRIACISLSKRVSYETLNEYGSQVGYQIRFERQRTEHTRIVFLTEGLLLRQVASDASLSSYDIIILDEIHERHLHTDFLLGIVKCLLMQSTSLKIILMSATINIDLFSKYFLGKAPVIQVPGRLYPIKLQYFPIPILEQTTKSDKINPAPYVRILQLIDSKYKEDERGDVLIFLSGFSEINIVSEAAKLYSQKTKRWVILPLHSNLSVTDQEKVFDVAPPGIRKCIVSTNIAETSVTIDGVRFVVDSGKVKEMSYDSVCKMQKLKEFWVSQASAEQRKGRAGRTGPGVCFRLYSAEHFESLEPYTTPEIQRVPLDSLVLQMISMGLPDVRLFPFIEPPSKESLEVSVAALKSQAAISDDESLTTTGKLLSQLPVDVSIGKMLLMGSLFHQVEATLSLAAALSVQCVFTSRAQRDPDCANALQELVSSHGDPLTVLNCFKGWLEEKYSDSRRFTSSRWCRQRGLEEQRFYEITKLRHQFSTLLQQSKLYEAPSSDGKCKTAAERARRHGELQQLRSLQRETKAGNTKKAKMIRVDHEGNALSDGESEKGLDPKHLDFSIKNDSKQLLSLLQNSDVRSFRDIIMLKIVVSSGLYPNIAIADGHNNYKPGSEQLFHTPTKPFAALHPTSVLARQPEVLEITEADIVELPDFNRANPAATRHQILLYVSLLETNKVFLMNTFRAPTLQTLFMFARNIDTNADLSIVVCDNFIELRFPDANVVQNLIVKTVQLRQHWNKLLELKLDSSDENVDILEALSASAKLERQLSDGLVDFYMQEPLHSQRRLLAADVKVLHKGPGFDDAILDPNPFTGKACVPHSSKGGMKLTDWLTYSCLFDMNCSVTTLSETESICPLCDETLHCRTLQRLQHLHICEGPLSSKARAEDLDSAPRDPNAKEFWCEECKKTLWLTIKQIFDHKKQHAL